MGTPWTAIALGGTAILEALFGELFKPKGMKKFQNETVAKGRSLLASPGYGQDVINAIFGRGFENIKLGGKAVRDQTTEAYSRQGMAGTGSELKAQRENMWSNQRLVTEAMRDLLISSEAKKQSDIALATQMLGTVSGSAAGQQGPAISEYVLSAILQGMMKPKAAVDGPNGGGEGWLEIFNNYGAIKDRGNFGSFNWGAPIPANPDAIMWT
jgi:hypothetical protein